MSLLPSRPDATPAEDAGPRVIDVDSDDADEVLSALSSATARQLLNELHEKPAPPSTLANQVDTSVQNTKYHLDKLESAGAVEVVDTAYSEKGREMDVYAPADQPLVIYAGGDDDRGTIRTALSRLLGSLGVLAFASLLVQALFGESIIPWADDEVPHGDDTDGTADGEDADEIESEETDGEQADPEPDSDGEATDDGDGFGIAQTDDTEETNVTETDSSETDATETDSSETDATETDPTDGDTVTDVHQPSTDEMEAATEAAASIPPGVLFFAGGLLVITLIFGYMYFRRERVL